MTNAILGDPGADSGGKGKSKRAEKYGTKKSKERRQESLGPMSYQTSSKRWPPFCLLIGQKNTKVFWHQSEARTTATVWNLSGKTLSPGVLLADLFFSSCHIFKLIALKSIERREEPLGTMSYQTSSKRSPPFWLLISARKTQVFWHQSEARTTATVCN